MRALFGQLLVGLINGSFYALLSHGLAIIFGLLNVVNCSHGALYMTGAFVAWMGLQSLGVPYWGALLLSPIAVGLLGVVIERTMLRRLYQLDHLYGLLLTFGLTLIIEGLFHHQYGNSGNSYPVPALLQGGATLGFMFLPKYRAWVVVFSVAVCLAVWWGIERTKLGSSSAIASLAGSRFNSLAFAAPGSWTNDEILVVCFLRGGQDGLNLVVPTGGATNDHQFYDQARPQIRITAAEANQRPLGALSGTSFGFHPAMAPLYDLYQAEQAVDRHGLRHGGQRAQPLRFDELDGARHARALLDHQRLADPPSADR